MNKTEANKRKIVAEALARGDYEAATKILVNEVKEKGRKEGLSKKEILDLLINSFSNEIVRRIRW